MRQSKPSQQHAHRLRRWFALTHTVSNSESARRLGLHERVVRRMLDPGHATKAEKVQAALAVLGKQISVEISDTA